MILDHPITHANQQFICPSDADTNDDVGQVTRGLVTHADFFFDRWGIQLLDSDYKCQIESGNTDNAFSLNADTGALKIAVPGNFVSTRTLTVRVYPDQYPWYFMDCSVEILYIPAADCIYFDVDNTGGDGTRANPYTKYSDNVYGGAAWGLSSIPGKTFLWKRGKTWTNEWTVTNTGTNEATAPIRFGAWGQGARPIIDLSLNATSERFAQVGLASMSGPAEDSKMSNNIYYYDFEITHDRSSIVYPVQVVPMGRFIEFHRFKMTNVTFKEGFVWLAGPTNYPSVDRKILLKDIFTYEHGIDAAGAGESDWPRAIKVETGGVTAHNIYNETAKNYHTSAYSGGGTHPITESKFCKTVINTKLNPDLFSMQVRGAQQTYQWCVIDGTDYALTIFGQVTSNNNIPDSTSVFDGFILKNIGKFSLTSINSTALNMDGVKVKRVVAIGDAKPMIVYGGDQCINTLFQNCILYNPGDHSFDSIQVGTQANQNGNGTTIIENCLVYGLENHDSQTIVRNTIYDVTAGSIAFNFTTSLTPVSSGDYKNANYEPTVAAAQLGAGTADAGLLIDLNGDDRLAPPSIGPYEYTAQDLSNPNPPTTDLWRFRRLVLPVDFFGNLIYDTYQTSKAANGNFEVPFVQIKNLVNNVKDFGWDLLCVPFTNKDDTVYSMIGPNLTVTGGGNGSKFNRFGLLETELPADRPRFTFNPEDIGKFEGLLIEANSENIVELSNSFLGVGYNKLSGTVIEENVSNSPEGLNNASRLTMISSSSTIFNYLINTPFSNIYFSFFVKNNGGGPMNVGYSLSTTSGWVFEFPAFTPENYWERKVFNFENFPVNADRWLGVDNNNNANAIDALIYGWQVENEKSTSYIATSGSPVTRPADTLQATGAITGTTYTIVKYTSENKIAYYYDAGDKTTYIDGVNTGTVAEAPSNDFTIQSTGSEKVQLMGLIEGAKTNQELIDLTI